jgi:antitoxin MazE
MQRLTRWGNSVGLRIPMSVLEAAGLKPGSHVYVRLLNSGDIRVRPVTRPQVVCEDGPVLPRGPVKDEW